MYCQPTLTSLFTHKEQDCPDEADRHRQKVARLEAKSELQDVHLSHHEHLLTKLTRTLASFEAKMDTQNQELHAKLDNNHEEFCKKQERIQNSVDSLALKQSTLGHREKIPFFLTSTMLMLLDLDLVVQAMSPRPN